jgi:hypothetical protein
MQSNYPRLDTRLRVGVGALRVVRRVRSDRLVLRRGGPAAGERVRQAPAPVPDPSCAPSRPRSHAGLARPGLAVVRAGRRRRLSSRNLRRVPAVDRRPAGRPNPALRSGCFWSFTGFVVARVQRRVAAGSASGAHGGSTSPRPHAPAVVAGARQRVCWMLAMPVPASFGTLKRWLVAAALGSLVYAGPAAHRGTPRLAENPSGLVTRSRQWLLRVSTGPLRLGRWFLGGFNTVPVVHGRRTVLCAVSSSKLLVATELGRRLDPVERARNVRRRGRCPRGAY